MKPAFDEQWAEYIAFERHRIETVPTVWLSQFHFGNKHRVSYWVFKLINYWGEVQMARGAKQTTATNAKSVNQWTKFVDISLGETTLKDVGVEYPTIDEVNEHLSNALMNGYRLSVSYNPANDAVIASFTCKDEESVNAGCTLSAFAGTWADAISVLLYKHYVIAKQNWIASSQGAGKVLIG